MVSLPHGGHTTSGHRARCPGIAIAPASLAWRFAVDARKSGLPPAPALSVIWSQIRRGSSLQIWWRTSWGGALRLLRSAYLSFSCCSTTAQGGSMVAGSVMVAGVAAFGCFMMATMASVSAQQIGDLQGQPSNAPSTPGTGKPTRANPAPLVVACSGAFARDSHHLKLTMTLGILSHSSARSCRSRSMQ